VLSRLEDQTNLDRPSFSYEATFHVCETVSVHSHHVWGSENPQDVAEHERDSPEVSVWCALMKDKIIISALCHVS
jgi:hypothetical protein